MTIQTSGTLTSPRPLLFRYTFEGKRYVTIASAPCPRPLLFRYTFEGFRFAFLLRNGAPDPSSSGIPSRGYYAKVNASHSPRPLLFRYTFEGLERCRFMVLSSPRPLLFRYTFEGEAILGSGKGFSSLLESTIRK